MVFMGPRTLQEATKSDEIRRALLEQDLLETIIALPGRLSPISSMLLYGLVFSNCKAAAQRGKVQVIDLRPYFEGTSDRCTAARTLTASAMTVLRDALRTIRAGHCQPNSTLRVLHQTHLSSPCSDPVRYVRTQINSDVWTCLGDTGSFI